MIVLLMVVVLIDYGCMQVGLSRKDQKLDSVAPLAQVFMCMPCLSYQNFETEFLDLSCVP